MTLQKGWRACNRCESLYFADAAGACPKGGAHDSAGSRAYMPQTSAAQGAQDGWRWCRRCGGMFYANAGGGRCINGAAHDAGGSGAYWVQIGGPTGVFTQTGWRWCRNCHLLHHGARPGACPANGGGAHSVDGSGDYGLNCQIRGKGSAIAFQSAGDSGEIWLLLRQNGAFLPPVRVPGGCSNSPSPVMHRGKLYLFYQGMGNCRDLYYTTFDGFEFSGSIRGGDVRLRGAPSAVSYDNDIVVFVQGTSETRSAWRCTMTPDGKWSSYELTGGAMTWNDPGAVMVPVGEPPAPWSFYEMGQKDYMPVAPASASGTGRIWANCGHNGGGPMGDYNSCGSPSAAWFKDRVYLFSEWSGGSGELWYYVGTPNRKFSEIFSPRRRVPNVGMSGVTGPVAEGDVLHVFHEGLGDCGELWYVSTTDGDHWGNDQRVPGVGVSDGCGACSFDFG